MPWNQRRTNLRSIAKAADSVFAGASSTKYIRVNSNILSASIFLDVGRPTCIAPIRFLPSKNSRMKTNPGGVERR